MKQLAVAAMALSIWVIPIPQTPRQPSAGVAKKQSVTETQLAQDARDKQQAAENSALNAILAAITKNEQERAAERQQEAAIESENVHLQRWIIGVGIAQTIALIGTLVFIGWQAKETANAAKATGDAARAASRSADALISAERAWVLADFDYPERPHTFYEYSLIFTNHGPTPARIESFFWETKAIDSIEELPPTPVYGVAQYSGRLLAPREPWSVDMVFPNDVVSMERWTEVMKHKDRYVICLGYVVYGGIFEGKRYTRFCFGYNGYLPRFTVVGPTAYNDYT